MNGYTMALVTEKLYHARYRRKIHSELLRILNLHPFSITCVLMRTIHFTT